MEENNHTSSLDWSKIEGPTVNIISEDMITVPVGMQTAALLDISLNDLTSVPTVFYNGVEVKNKVKISFEWETKNEYDVDSPTIRIEYVPEGSSKTALIVHKGIAINKPTYDAADYPKPEQPEVKEGWLDRLKRKLGYAVKE